jgi:hypothetical protein
MDERSLAMAFDSSNRALLAGYWSNSSSFNVSRLTGSWALDSGFGPFSGMTGTNMGAGELARDLITLADDSIVAVGEVAGTIDDDFVVVKYQSDGSLDLSFGDQ